MGGEKLKLPVFALLLFGVGCLVKIPLVSAQEAQSQGTVVQEDQSAAVDPYAAERDINIGAEAGNDDATGVSSASSSIWVVIRMILVLALAAAAVYGVVFFIKRSSKPAAGNDPFLKILASASLGSNRFAHIVSVGSKAWLLGSSDGGVNLIGEIDDKDVINAMLLEDSRKSTETQGNRFSDFISILRRFGAPAQPGNPDAGDIRKRRERLKGL